MLKEGDALVPVLVPVLDLDLVLDLVLQVMMIAVDALHAVIVIVLQAAAAAVIVAVLVADLRRIVVVVGMDSHILETIITSRILLNLLIGCLVWLMFRMHSPLRKGIIIMELKTRLSIGIFPVPTRLPFNHLFMLMDCVPRISTPTVPARLLSQQVWQMMPVLKT